MSRFNDIASEIERRYGSGSRGFELRAAIADAVRMERSRHLVVAADLDRLADEFEGTELYGASAYREAAARIRAAG